MRIFCCAKSTSQTTDSKYKVEPYASLNDILFDEDQKVITALSPSTTDNPMTFLDLTDDKALEKEKKIQADQELREPFL